MLIRPVSTPNLNLLVKFLIASSLASSFGILSILVGRGLPNNSVIALTSPNVPISSTSATKPAPTPPPIPIAKIFVYHLVY
jgi:hypothetical protein